MITGQVRKIMASATKRLAETENVDPSEITIVIHTKSEERFPEYYYLIKNTPKMDGDKPRALQFKQDLLGKKIDMINMEGMAAQFLSARFQFFERLHEEEGFKAEDMDLLIKPKSNEVQDFNILFCHRRKFVKNYTLDDIFDIG